MKTSSWTWGTMRRAWAVGMMAVLAGCAAMEPQTARISGSAIISNAITLPDGGSQMIVRLIDRNPLPMRKGAVPGIAPGRIGGNGGNSNIAGITVGSGFADGEKTRRADIPDAAGLSGDRPVGQPGQPGISAQTAASTGTQPGPDGQAARDLAVVALPTAALTQGGTQDFALLVDRADLHADGQYVLVVEILDEQGQVLLRGERSDVAIGPDGGRVLAPGLVGGGDVAANPATDGAHGDANQPDGPIVVRLDQLVLLASVVARHGAVSDMTREIAAIRAGLTELREIPGRYSDGDTKVSYQAYVSADGNPVYVSEQRDFGAYGKSDVAFYYRKGTLLRFVENASRPAFSGAGSVNANANAAKPARAAAGGADGDADGLDYRLLLDFVAGTFAEGRKTLNGSSDIPDMRDINAALAQSKVAQSRVKAAIAVEEAAPIGGRQSFVCADQSRFYASFELRHNEVLVELLGREPLVLQAQKTGSGYDYAGDGYELRGKGKQARWSGPHGSTDCSVSAEIAGLALGPGDFPVIDLGDLAGPSNREWTRDIAGLLPAINACLAVSSDELPSVLKAWPMEHGMVGVRTINAAGGRYDCLAPDTGLGDVHTELVEANTNRLPQEDDVRFTPANGAYPEGECYRHERVEQGGVFIGWLSHNICGG